MSETALALPATNTEAEVSKTNWRDRMVGVGFLSTVAVVMAVWVGFLCWGAYRLLSPVCMYIIDRLLG